MQFVTLTRTLLLDLQSKGYNVLTSKNIIDDRNPSWYAITVPDVWDYMLRMDCRTMNDTHQELAIWVIADAIKNMKDEQLVGQVFIEDDYCLRLQQRLHIYNQYYDFTNHPEIYDYSYDPQRVLIRNHAVHSGDHAMYLAYLEQHYPDHTVAGMKDLEHLTRSLICLDTTQARDWLFMHRVAVIETDIWFCDEDAILKVWAIQRDDYTWEVSDDTEELIYSQVTPNDILPLRDIFWIDPRFE